MRQLFLPQRGGASSLVPPSIDLIIIAVVANISVGGMFAGGILPSVFIAIALVSVAYFYAKKLKLPPNTSEENKCQIDNAASDAAIGHDRAGQNKKWNG